MTHHFLIPFLAAFAVCSANSATIAQWDFNSTASPSIGNGLALLIGGTTATYASGSPSDPAATNQAWNTSTYPAQGSSNKMAGIEFRVSSEGFQDLRLSWEQRQSATASKYFRCQYSVDGLTFHDLPNGLVTATVTGAFEQRTLSLIGVPGVDDNPLLALRLVAEFENSALGTGADGYVTTHGTNGYTRSGTVRLDLVELSGEIIAGANTGPTISTPTEQTLRVGQVSPPIPFSVYDREDAPEALAVTGEISDPGVLAGLSLGGSGTDRHLVLTAGGICGRASVRLTVTDSGGRSSGTEFWTTVLPSNTPPEISAMPATNLITGLQASLVVAFTVADLEQAPEQLSLAASSSNIELVPNSQLSFEGEGTNRSLQITPVAGRAGVAVITVRVGDGLEHSSRSFGCMVVPSSQVLVQESFAYADGSVVTNSGSLWQSRSGLSGDCQIRGGQLEVSGECSEDVLVDFAGGTRGVGQGTVLYASFRFCFVGTPKSRPEYFAHFRGGASLRGRVYAGATDLWPGAFRLYVANGSDTNAASYWNLSTNTVYRAVTRYEVDAAQTTLWLNPSAESDPGAIAIDAQSSVAIGGYGFRQDAGLGTVVWVDDLRVGLSFEAVTGQESPPARLYWEMIGGRLGLICREPGYVLQSSAGLNDFADEGGIVSPFTNMVQPRLPEEYFRLRKE